jgi:hypothetical protein
MGVGTRRLAAARVALDRDLPAGLWRPVAGPAGLSRARVGQLAARPGDRPGVPGQVGDRSRHRFALRRLDHHGTGRARGFERRPRRGRRAGDVQPRGRVPVHRGRSSPWAVWGWQLWFGAAGADRRGEHQQSGRGRSRCRCSWWAWGGDPASGCGPRHWPGEWLAAPGAAAKPRSHWSQPSSDPFGPGQLIRKAGACTGLPRAGC